METIKDLEKLVAFTKPSRLHYKPCMEVKVRYKATEEFCDDGSTLLTFEIRLVGERGETLHEAYSKMKIGEGGCLEGRWEELERRTVHIICMELIVPAISKKWTNTEIE